MKLINAEKELIKLMTYELYRKVYFDDRSFTEKLCQEPLRRSLNETA